MRAMRKVEQLICNCQAEARANIYKKEINTYHKIGENKMDKFYEKYYNLF
jgi:hypothetical protein